MKRTFLFVVTNIAVMLVLAVVFHVVCSLTGVSTAALERDYGINYLSLAIFAMVFGMGGAMISLLMSKQMAKWSVKAQVITGDEGPAERWLVETVRDLSQRAGVKMPEVAIYQGAANAFATGAFKNSALVAVSTDIMRQMTKEELRAVLGHEMSHVANGDMVTMTLLQGVLNAVVLFLSRVLGLVADSALSGGKGNRRRGGGVGYFLVYMVCQTVLGLLASMVVMAFSRRREYAADAGSADLLGSPQSMISALRRLGNLQPGVLPNSLKAMGIGGNMKTLLASQPPLEERIEALQRWSPEV